MHCARVGARAGDEVAVASCARSIPWALCEREELCVQRKSTRNGFVGV
jgi:hypothetical protein